MDWRHLLHDMDRVEVFAIISADATILRIGRSIYSERKPTKEKATRIKVRSAMRRMARLLQATVGVTETSELFDIGNFYHLQDAIVKLCVETSGGRPKAGLKVAIGSLIKKAADILVTYMRVARNNEGAAAVEIFRYVFLSNYSHIFAVAEYQLKEKRHRENRKPAALPNEEHLQKLRVFLVDTIQEHSKLAKADVTQKVYIHLRKVVLMVRSSVVGNSEV